MKRDFLKQNTVKQKRNLQDPGKWENEKSKIEAFLGKYFNSDSNVKLYVIEYSREL